MAGISARRAIAMMAAAAVVGGCAQYQTSPPVTAAHANGEWVIVNEPRDTIPFCAEYEALCVIAGIAVLGGAVAAIESSGS